MRSYRGKVHEDVHDDDHEADDKGDDPQVESFPAQTLGAIVVLFIIALLGLQGERKVREHKLHVCLSGNLC